MILRPSYQTPAVDAVGEHLSNHASTLLVMATGLGKTLVAAEVIKRFYERTGRSALFLADRDHLIWQSKAAIEEHTGLSVGVEMNVHRAEHSLFSKDKVIVSTVQTQISGRPKKRMERFRPEEFGLVIIDECFPADTTVDGRPIQTLKKGDRIRTHNGTGFVTNVFRKAAPERLMRIQTEDGQFVCTENHPIWTTIGFREAKDLTPHSMVLSITDYDPRMQELRKIISGHASQQTANMLEGVRVQSEKSPQKAEATNGVFSLRHGSSASGNKARRGNDAPRTNLLFRTLSESSEVQTVLRNPSCDKQEICLQANDSKQSHVPTGREGKSIYVAASHGMEASNSRRQRTTHSTPATSTRRIAGLAMRSGGRDEPAARFRISTLLQNRHCELGIETWHRGGWAKPFCNHPTGTGLKEGSIPRFTGLAHIEVLKRGDNGEFEKLCPDGFVYNLEVSNGSTYFANGILVHNCHQSAAPTYAHIWNHYRQNPNIKLLGITATPVRADGKPLMFESMCYQYGIRAGVQDGWLVHPAQQFIKVDSLDWSECRVSRNGEFRDEDVARVVETKENIAGICHPSLEVIFGLEPETLSSQPLSEWPGFLKRLGKVPRRTIIFTASVKQAEECCHILNTAYPGLAEWVCGETDKDKRENLLERFKDGRTAVVANVGVLCQGYDNPYVEVVIMARAIRSLTLYTQQLGRGTRTLPGLVDDPALTTALLRRQAIANSAKPLVRIVDFKGNSGRFKLVNSMHVLAGDVMSDEAIERAVNDAIEGKKPKRVLAALSNAEKKLQAEQAERQREIERQRLLKCKAPKASYRVRDVDAFGNESFRTGERNGKGEKEIPAFVMKKLRAHQMREPANYKQAMVLYQVCKKREETMPISERNKQRLTAIGYDVQGWTQAKANRAWQEYFVNDKQKPLVSRV